MEPLTAMAIPFGINLVSNIIGGIAASDKNQEAMDMLKAAMARIDGLQIPDLSKKIIYDRFVSVGNFTPQMLEKTIEEYAPIALLTENPANKAKMEATLAEQQQLTKGPSAQAQLEYERARRLTEQGLKSKIASTKRQMQSTGNLGTGEDLAATLASIEDSTSQNALANMQIAGQSEAQQSSALDSYLRNLAANRQYETELESQRVAAQNLARSQAIQNSYGRQQANIAALNAANLGNLERQQTAANSNVAVNQKEQYRQAVEAPLTAFEMAMRKLGMYNDLQRQMAGITSAQAQGIQQGWANIGAGATQLGAAAFGQKVSPVSLTIPLPGGGQTGKSSENISSSIQSELGGSGEPMYGGGGVDNPYNVGGRGFTPAIPPNREPYTMPGYAGFDMGSFGNNWFNSTNPYSSSPNQSGSGRSPSSINPYSFENYSDIYKRGPSYWPRY